MLKWNQFPSVSNCKQLDEYIVARWPRKTSFCHYTNLTVIDGIINKRQFWVSSIKNFNDTHDRVQFGYVDNTDSEDNELISLKYYSLCFSSGVNENLSLWYMYSGMDGKGGRIRFNTYGMECLIRDGTYKLYELVENDNGSKSLGNLVKKLSEKSGDFIVKVQDVLYYSDNKKDEYASLKYNTMTNYGKIKKKELQEYRQKKKGFFKRIAWYYEKEFRILVELKDEIVNKLSKNKSYVVVLDIPDATYKRIYIDFAPEVENIDEVLCGKNAIKEFIFDTSASNYSDYKGEVKMNFCSKCNKQMSKKGDEAQ